MVGESDKEADRIRLENFFLNEYADFGELAGLDNRKAFVELEGVGNPKDASFQAFAYWALYSPKNYTHLMNAKLEMIYYNGTVFKKVVLPTELGTHPDNNNTPETAEEIQNGTYVGKCIGGYDHNDFYKINLTSGQNLNVQLQHASTPAPVYSLIIYDAALNEKIHNDSIDIDKTATVTADSTGFWLIEVRSVSPDLYCGFYSMEASR